MPLYINSIGSISPHQISHISCLTSHVSKDDGHFVCVEPVYKEFINPLHLRRMSRILKMGLGASSICISHLPEAVIDAVIVGTGTACIADLEKFIVSVIYGNEQGLSPTPFINSSHNTVAAQIAMMHKITGYSNTYCHRGASFEAALTDAMMLLDEGEARHVLVGGIDEYSRHHHSLMSEECNMKDITLGEGSVFFILENEHSKNTFAELKGVIRYETLDNRHEICDIRHEICDFRHETCENIHLKSHVSHLMSDVSNLKSHISHLLSKHGLDMADIDLFVSGKNGNGITDGIYDELEREMFPNAEKVYYKHLCGEYMTSTAFALGLAAHQLKGQKHKHALIYNHYNYINHSIILATNCTN